MDCDLSVLKYADAAFEGYGPKGTTIIGVERKTLHDILDCIDTNRYNEQRQGMAIMYGFSYLIIEGLWKPREDGLLMEGFRDDKAEGLLKTQGKIREVIAWTPYKPGTGKPVMYSKLFRYLMSVALSGVNVIFTRDLRHTAHDICEEFHYFQKPWHKHTALREVYQAPVPTARIKPTVTRLWANSLEGIGVVLGEEAARYFRKPIRLANSDEADWIRCGVDVKTAQNIIKEIQGW